MFIKCFLNSDSRKRLNINIILQGKETSEMKKQFNYFKSLRNKQVAHDDNVY